MLTNMIMSVGYKPYIKSEVFRMCRRKTCVVLTTIPAMKAKPRLSIKPNADIRYIICNSTVNHSVIIDTSGGVTYPNAAINKTGLDEQNEDPIGSYRSTSFIQVFSY